MWAKTVIPLPAATIEKIRTPRGDLGLAALEARLGWPAVMAEGCRWIIGDPGTGARQWCGAPCITSGDASRTAWCADHWRWVYMSGESDVDRLSDLDATAEFEVANPTANAA
jgi:hypothetical protein